MRFFTLLVLPVLLFGSFLKGQGQVPIDSVKVKQADQLGALDGKFVLKLGTIYRDTKKADEDKLMSVPQTIVISNGDRTLDVVYNVGKTEKGDLIPFAEEFAQKGFDDMQIAQLKIVNNELKLIIEENEDDLYTVTIGIYDGAVPVDATLKILSVAGLRSVYDPTAKRYVYVHGVYYNQLKAKEVTLALANAGLYPDVLRYGKGILSGVKPSNLYSPSELMTFEAMKADPAEIRTEQIVFRVQVGTYSSNITQDLFGDVEVLIFPHNEKLLKCYAGAFTSYKDAYKYKLELKEKGIKGAFIVAYKDGESLSIGELVSKEEYEAIKAEFGG